MERKLLIFDLDETLVHATKDKLSHDHDFIVESYYVYVRPNLEQLLDYCSSKFELGVWSSSSSEYVSHVVSQLFGSKYPLLFSWSVERCVQREDPVSNGYVYIKDLRKVKSKGYDVEDILIVDDSPEKIKRQPKRLIQVNPFEGDMSDVALIELTDRLGNHV